MNSAIEAARAGEYGNRFAVVSNVVRKLPDQTKRSIAEIDAIVQSSNEYMHERCC
ncbi:methyl-accepting chemotaxis protein [Peribacillus frigoritolerans]|uniref:methyl-accepting chemotaxis protein n=1 Tax=Peribacillus frigoritolerans TaxID=450367 RepID=UPI00358DCB83